MSTTVTVPTLTTERLVLRAHRVEDFEAYAAMMASERAQYMDQMERNTAWLAFVTDAGGWLLFGHGAWAIDLRTTGEMIGQIGIQKPDNFPEIEMGWMLLSGHEGRGYATEAATAARDWAFGPRGLPTLVSYISPGNTRSIALAERLGARRDHNAASPGPDDLVYRHPHPEAA